MRKWVETYQCIRCGKINSKTTETPLNTLNNLAQCMRETCVTRTILGSINGGTPMARIKAEEVTMTKPNSKASK